MTTSPAASWDYDCAVIGGGPGGMVSALYLKRFKRNIALFQHGKPRAAWIPRTYNLIGYHQGISGKALLKRLGKQISELKIPKINGEARLRRVRNGFEVRVGQKRFRVKKAIIATGFTDIQPEINNIAELRNLGLLRYCPVCDAFEHQKKSILVFAQDEGGIQRASFLSRYTRKVKIILPFRFKLSVQRKTWLKKQFLVCVKGEIKTISPIKNKKAIKVVLKNKKALVADVGYVELGCTVNNSAFEHIKSLRKTKAGFLIATSEQRLSVKGLYAVGDCVNQLGQVSVAAGQGAVAATAVHEDLEIKIK